MVIYYHEVNSFDYMVLRHAKLHILWVNSKFDSFITYFLPTSIP